LKNVFFKKTSLMQNIKYSTIDEYISSFPKNIQKMLGDVRSVIRKIAPDSVEAISYGIPTFKLNGNLVHFAAFKNHIGFYPTPNGIEEFEKELSVYKQGKGSVQFPVDKPLPLDLISKIVKYRVKKNSEKNSIRKK
jgi:uncharacterized protein YdhG (YjbR/CyaY superfamily)